MFYLEGQHSTAGIRTGFCEHVPYNFVKLDLEIAVDQQTRASDQTFYDFSDLDSQLSCVGWPHLFLGQNTKLPNMIKAFNYKQ